MFKIQLTQIIVIISFALFFAARTDAQSAPTTTEFGLYGFASNITGTSQLGNVTADIDVPFSTILENLDIGFMGYVDHRRGKWSFIGDLFYADITASSNAATNAILTVNVDTQVKQTMAEMFVGYQVYDQIASSARFSVDVLGGLRYNKLNVGLDARAAVLGLTTTASRSRSEIWVDAVIGMRAKYDFGSGWNLGGWLDVGKGADSSSYQVLANVSYKFANNVKVFGGYRLYHFEYESDPGPAFFSIDADYAGPMIGVAYQF